MKQSEAVQESRVDEKPFVALLALLDVTQYLLGWWVDRKELQVCYFLREVASQRGLVVAAQLAEPIGILLVTIVKILPTHISHRV